MSKVDCALSIFNTNLMTTMEHIHYYMDTLVWWLPYIWRDHVQGLLWDFPYWWWQWLGMHLLYSQVLYLFFEFKKYFESVNETLNTTFSSRMLFYNPPSCMKMIYMTPTRVDMNEGSFNLWAWMLPRMKTWNGPGMDLETWAHCALERGNPLAFMNYLWEDLQYNKKYHHRECEREVVMCTWKAQNHFIHVDRPMNDQTQRTYTIIIFFKSLCGSLQCESP